MGTGSHQTSVEIDRQTITELLEELNDKLAEHDVSGEMYIVGGAAMVLAYEASRSTSDIDCVISNGSPGPGAPGHAGHLPAPRGSVSVPLR